MSEPVPVILCPGECRVCGCTEHTPCVDSRGQPCWWVDQAHTLCSSPTCIGLIPMWQLDELELEG